MAYVRYDYNNVIADPQPASTTVNQFSGTEGWSTVTYKDWNGDYVTHDYANAVRTPGTYQARNYDNTVRTPGTYQRYGASNVIITDAGSGGIDCSTLPAGQYLDLTAKKSFGVGGQEITPRGVFVGSSGTKMYITGETGDGVDQYSLSTAWDPSTASHDYFYDASTLTPKDLFFSSDGTKLYVLDDFWDRVYQYTLSTAWDLSGGVSSSTYFTLTGTTSQISNPTGLTFSSDGVYMYVMSSYLRYLNRYTLSTPWDVTSAYGRIYSNFPANAITNTGQETGIAISDDGARFVIVHVHSDVILEYTFSTPYDVSAGATYKGSLSVASDSTFPTGCCWGNDGQYFYVSSSSPTDTVFRYETCSDGAYKILGRP